MKQKERKALLRRNPFDPAWCPLFGPLPRRSWVEKVVAEIVTGARTVWGVSPSISIKNYPEDERTTAKAIYHDSLQMLAIKDEFEHRQFYSITSTDGFRALMIDRARMLVGTKRALAEGEYPKIFALIAIFESMWALESAKTRDDRTDVYLKNAVTWLAMSDLPISRPVDLLDARRYSKSGAAVFFRKWLDVNIPWCPLFGQLPWYRFGWVPSDPYGDCLELIVNARRLLGIDCLQEEEHKYKEYARSLFAYYHTIVNRVTWQGKGVCRDIASNILYAENILIARERAVELAARLTGTYTDEWVTLAILSIVTAFHALKEIALLDESGGSTIAQALFSEAYRLKMSIHEKNVARLQKHTEKFSVIRKNMEEKYRSEILRMVQDHPGFSHRTIAKNLIEKLGLPKESFEILRKKVIPSVLKQFFG